MGGAGGESWGGGVNVMGVFNFGRKSQTAIGYEHVKPPTQKLYTVSQKRSHHTYDYNFVKC